MRGSVRCLSEISEYVWINVGFLPKSENGRAPPIAGKESRLETGGVKSLPLLFKLSTARSTSGRHVSQGHVLGFGGLRKILYRPGSLETTGGAQGLHTVSRPLLKPLYTPSI